MVFELAQLKKIRTQLGLTQHAFAAAAGISQSMVAKIESGKLDPTYSYVRKIESTLASWLQKEEKHARDIMSKDLIIVKGIEPVSSVIKTMDNYSISQIPVIDKGHIVGIITEASILAKNQSELAQLHAYDVLEEAPPIISEQTTLTVIKQLLQHYNAILVKDKNKVSGIITRSDLIKHLA